jgi:hypothetical protein
MQAVMYASMGPLVDFWWIKPQKTRPRELEEQTLHRHTKGQHKNDPGQSRKVYSPIADCFAKGTSEDGKLRFTLTRASPDSDRTRACIECLSSGARYYLCLVWMEGFPSNPFGKKYVTGKIVYQHEPNSTSYYVRPYAIHDKSLVILPGTELEEPVETVLPPDHIKLDRRVPARSSMATSEEAVVANVAAVAGTSDGTS